MSKTQEQIQEILDKWHDDEHPEPKTVLQVEEVLTWYYGKGGYNKVDVNTAQTLIENESGMNPAGLSLRDSSKIIAEKIGKFLNTTTKFWATSKKSRIHHYNPEIGIWQDDGEEIIAARATEIINEYEESSFMNHIINEVTAYIRFTNMHSKQILIGPPEIMVLENGRINIETGEFNPEFDPEEHHIVRIPVRYDSDARCPEIDKFLGEVLDTEEDILAMYELSGYCLFKYAVFDIIVVMVGSGANGKGILQEIMTAFLGEENVVSITLQQLAERPFASAGLYGKLANLAGEIPSTAIKVTERIKDLTGGNFITGEHKGRDPFKFRPFTVLWFATNNPPQIWDDSEGFWRRFRRFDFPNTFPKGAEGTIPRDKLVAKLTTSEELSGYLNRVLEGWTRFRRQGDLTGDRGIVRERTEWTRMTDPIKYLAKTYVLKDRKGPEILKKGMYELYLRFCDAEEQDARTDTTFHKNFKRICGYVSDYRKRVAMKNKKGEEISVRVRIYRGLKIDIEGLREIGVNLNDIEFRPDPEQSSLDEFFESIQGSPAGPTGPTISTPEPHDILGEEEGSSRASRATPEEPKKGINLNEFHKIDLSDRETRFLREHMIGSGFEPAVEDMDMVSSLVAKGCLSDEVKTGIYQVTERVLTILKEGE